ncbi:MAG: aconitate hydratase AcnA [Firmicutes bacterium]|nr:aconitate hydratase AcnA [Bacillota bacterium]
MPSPQEPFPFHSRRQARVQDRTVAWADLGAVEAAGLGAVRRLPYSLRVLLESLLRQHDGYHITLDHIRRLAAWDPARPEGEIPFKPARVLLQDFTGVPVVADLAAMRDEVARRGGDPARVNPLVPVDLVIDHSVQVDRWAAPDAFAYNVEQEFARNRERYAFLRWAQSAFRNLRVVPPDRGIVHQVNLEYLATVVAEGRDADGTPLLYPDTVVGTDSHTTMVNGLGVLGWGVGGIEAEANLLGQPLYIPIPAVVGVRLTGTLAPGTTATDAVLTLTEQLRRHGVVGKFVEFFGPGLAGLPLADRATMANMAPEYGATLAFFPPDQETLRYLTLSGRDPDRVALVAWYLETQQLLYTPGSPEPAYSEVLEFPLDRIEPSVAGPKRPQDRIPLGQVGERFRLALHAPAGPAGFGVEAGAGRREARVRYADGQEETLTDGSVVIAAITSCTNTSNPALMVAAGILARRAQKRGLRPPRYVKASLAPGSQVTTDYLQAAGLLEPLEALGFGLVGYGCTTCIGNSGPLAPEVAAAIRNADLVAAAVLSGNRNFEGRIHPLTRANYLASPPLVVAYALAGRVTIDLEREPLGKDRDGQPVFLFDLWPDPAEVAEVVAATVTADRFRNRYAHLFDPTPPWEALPVTGGLRYPWQAGSTYIQEPPFVDAGFVRVPPPPVRGARVLAAFGDSVTTDHISPAGSIPADSPAGRYLRERGVEPQAFNSYGSRRGNHHVMVRGTFANIRLRNLLVPGSEGGVTRHWPEGETGTIYDVAERYRAEGIPLLILAGREYGTGSSRDWAAKGPALLGVRAVLARSFERIHRSNLAGMGILPLQFLDGEGWQELGLDGSERYDIPALDDPGRLEPGQLLEVTATAGDGRVHTFRVRLRLDTPVEVDYYRQGGILPAVLQQLAPAGA